MTYNSSDGAFYYLTSNGLSKERASALGHINKMKGAIGPSLTWVVLGLGQDVQATCITCAMH